MMIFTLGEIIVPTVEWAASGGGPIQISQRLSRMRHFRGEIPQFVLSAPQHAT